MEQGVNLSENDEKVTKPDGNRLWGLIKGSE